MNTIKKTNSSLQKDINRMRKYCNLLTESNKLRKFQTSQFNNLIKKLLKEGRVTKEEVKEFITSKEESKNLILKKNESKRI